MTVFWWKNARRCNKPEQPFNQCTMKLSFKLVVVLNLQSSSQWSQWQWCSEELPGSAVLVWPGPALYWTEAATLPLQ